MNVDGPPTPGSPIERARIAEIIVTTGDSSKRRGSGYRIAHGAVLTAAHVVRGAMQTRIRFDPDQKTEWMVDAHETWLHPDSDLAVLTIEPRPEERVIEPVQFGRVVESGEILRASTVGFPRWKRREVDRPSGEGELQPIVFRDAHHAIGTVTSLSNWREGNLEVTVGPPAEDPEPGVSPWEGMSGAALWVGDSIVGVISAHHHSEGLGRLKAVRLDVALEDLEEDRRNEFWMRTQLREFRLELTPQVGVSLTQSRGRGAEMVDDIVVTEFEGHPCESDWERAYQDACHKARSEERIEVQDRWDTTQNISPSILVRVIRSADVESQEMQESLRGDSTYQSRDAKMSLGISPFGADTSAACARVFQLVGYPPHGLFRWIEGASSVIELRNIIFRWIVLTSARRADRRRSRPSLR